MRDGWSVRARSDDDLVPLVRVLRSVHERDGYPGRWPEEPAGWLTPAGLVSAWVVQDDTELLGHVALSTVDPGRSTAAAWAATVGEGLLLRCVTRLFVGHGARGSGAGSALLGAAVACARRAGARAVLEVASSDADAIALYRRQGWVEVDHLDGGAHDVHASMLFVASENTG